jgi:putative membrane protein insertion efficiency factor
MSVYEQSVRGAHRLYKLTLSPFVGRGCRYLPTCSDYARDALILHGPVAGLGLAIGRVCRCRPGGGAGFDPVPPRKGAAPFVCEP